MLFRRERKSKDQKVVNAYCEPSNLALAGSLECSLEGSELRRSGGTDTDLTVLNGLVGKGELGEIVTDHVSFDFDTVPVLASVDIDD